MRKKHQESTRERQANKHANDLLISNLKATLESAKKERFKMLKQIRANASQLREKELEREREVSTLRRREKQVSDVARRLEHSNRMHVRALCFLL